VSPVRVLGVCGLAAAVLSATGGFADVPVLIGIGGAVMLIGNVYAVWRGRSS
jgi:hypothetical protein